MLPPPDTFVRSVANALGVGKLQSSDGRTAVVDYFTGPGCPVREEEVPAGSVRAVELGSETRVYRRLADGAGWRGGRALAKHADGYIVRFPNGDPTPVPEGELFTRCELPLPDPAVFLAARVTETPLWQANRRRLVRAITDQRRVSAGLSGLLSAGIDLRPHQIEVARRVLHDPVQRYVLADEVGLGKTIEAGVVVRQFVLDHPHGHDVLVLVPPHLVRQWEDELEHRFRLGRLLGERVRVLPYHADLTNLRPGLIVIDEAHQVARWAADDPVRFDTVRRLTADPTVRLLLLSATPALHSDAAGFQALLHLLDPAIYPLGDSAGFGERLARHQRVAELYHQFRPDEAGGYLEGALDQLIGAFPADRRLAELGSALRPLLDFDADLDDPRREELVRGVRSHMSEVYRLHRRLLRNRRADQRVEPLLPGRAGLRRWAYDDPPAVRLGEALDEWRAAAVAAGLDPVDVGRRVVSFAQTAADDPHQLADQLDRQLDHRPAFAGEPALLGRVLDAARTSDPAAREAAVLAGLERQFGLPHSKVRRAVVFATSPPAADRMFDALAPRWPGQVVRHGRAGWRHFVTSPHQFRVLVCDRTAEEGLNLHTPGDHAPAAMMVHADLPWSPNRVEQRVGRLDRYGGTRPVVSAVPLPVGHPLASAWADYLDVGYGVFTRSVAALQYVIETEMAALQSAVATDGTEAVAAAVQRLGGETGVVAAALRDIQLLDELDAADAPPGHEHFADTLRQTDELRAGEWQAAVHGWAVDTLQFARRADGGHGSGRWRYQFQRPRFGGASTLLPAGRLVERFGHLIDTDDERSTPAAPLTHTLTFDRALAQVSRVSLARVGEPFVDALAEFIGWDDRGTAAAVWRHRPGTGFAHPAEVAVRFEFVVECSIEGAVAALPDADCGVAHALRRQADWLFPPFAQTVWVNADLELIPDSASISAVLAEPYTRGRRADGGRDYNLNPARWSAVEPHFRRSEWARLVTLAREAAEGLVRGTAMWAEQLAVRVAAARQSEADRGAQLASRLAFLSGRQRDEEEARSRPDAAVAAALRRGVETPVVRLDSVLAVFLADWNPFAGDEE